MSTHRYIDRICRIVLILVLVLTAVFVNGEALGIQTVSTVMGYEEKLFDTSSVHTIEIEMEDWDSFIENCTDEEYVECTVIIDKEVYKNVAIRAKGNTSLSQVKMYGNDRYSFKVEFDHYDSTKNYYGLDKLCLNNIIQDNTYMKDYLTYQMMGYFGVNAPLCSYAYITVNGEDWGLYLAVEGIEAGFLQRNYGSDYGKLYKPDSSDMGEVGRESGEAAGETERGPGEAAGEMGRGPGETVGGMDWERGSAAGGMGGAMGSDDVTLIYTDDDYDSYSNIFDNAKTDISDNDKDRLIASLKTLNEKEDIEETVNVEEVLRYFVVHNFVVNFDSYTGSMIHNYYLYEEDGQLSMIPWDYNLAFGGFQSDTDATGFVNYPIDSPVSGGTVESRPMLAWIFADEEYTELYHQYFAEFIEEYFDSGYFENMMDEVQEMIAPYVEKDPTKFCTYEEFEEGIATLKEFCMLRAESVSGQVDGSIPSTSEDQKAGTAALVDAGDMEISAMGSMETGQNGQGKATWKASDGQGEAAAWESPDVQGETAAWKASNVQGETAWEAQDGTAFETAAATASETSGEAASEESDNTTPDFPDEAPQAPGEGFGEAFGQGRTPDMNTDIDSQATNNTEGWILVGISASVLLFGLIGAFAFKRRG